jgi:hypothetical protein
MECPTTRVILSLSKDQFSCSGGLRRSVFGDSFVPAQVTTRLLMMIISERSEIHNLLW